MPAVLGSLTRESDGLDVFSGGSVTSPSLRLRPSIQAPIALAYPVNTRKTLFRKPAEVCSSVPTGNTAAGCFIVGDKNNLVPGKDNIYYVAGESSIFSYSSEEDAWMGMPASGIAGTFGAGSCGAFHACSTPGGSQTFSPSGTGTTTTFQTSLTLARNLEGTTLQVISGTNRGLITTITGNTLGANATITIAATASSVFDTTSVIKMFAGSLWFFNAGAGAVGFSVYDKATNAWTSRSVTNLPTTWGTEGQLVSTCSLATNVGQAAIEAATATGGGTSTISNSARSWVSDQWVNYQVRITGGLGQGQVRTITSSTSTSITVSPSWTTTPNSTSQYIIEGNDDFLWLLGNGANTIYKYTISTNTWASVSPTTARSGTAGAGMTASWVESVSHSTWTDGNYSPIDQAATIKKQNGRYIYSFRGGANASLDAYDIAQNRWVNSLLFGNAGETFSTGTSAICLGGVIYVQKDNTGRIYQFDVGTMTLKPFENVPIVQGTAIAGQKMFGTLLTEDGYTFRHLYSLGQTVDKNIRWAIA